MSSFSSSQINLKGLQSTLTAFEDISTIYRKLESQGNIEKLADLINQIYEQEHDFTINELNRYANQSNISDTDFFEEQYELNSSIFRKNFMLITYSMIDEIGRNYVQKFKESIKTVPDRETKDSIPNSRGSDLNLGILPSIQEENENDKTSLQSGRKDEDSLSQKINSASKELPVHPSLDTENNVGTPDTIDIIEEYPTGPVVIEEKPPTPYKPNSHDLPLKVTQKEPRQEVAQPPQANPRPQQQPVNQPLLQPTAESITAKYGSTPHKELKINEMLAQRAKVQEQIRNPQPTYSSNGRNPGHERVKTQPLEVVTEPDFLRTESDVPERDGRRTAQTTTNKSNNSFVNNYNFTPTNNRNERHFELSIDAAKANGLRNKSSERNSNVKNLNSSSSEPAKSPKSDKIREMRGNSPSNTSMSRTSVFSSTYNVDPSVLDSEFSYGKGMSFSRSKRKIHDEPQIAPGPGSYRAEDSTPAMMKKAPVTSFSKAPKQSIFETIKSETPGHIYYPSKHYVTK